MRAGGIFPEGSSWLFIGGYSVHVEYKKTYSDIGKSYKAVNNKLQEMTKELDTDLTTIDGFMWFISKHVKFI